MHLNNDLLARRKRKYKKYIGGKGESDRKSSPSFTFCCCCPRAKAQNQLGCLDSSYVCRCQSLCFAFVTRSAQSAK